VLEQATVEGAGEIAAAQAADSLLRMIAVHIIRIMAILCLAATAISCSARHWWLADLIANLRIQLILGLIVSIVGVCCVRQKRLAVCVMLALIWHCSWITPYLFAPRQPNGVRPLKICTVNVLTQNPHHDKIFAVLRSADPDVIAVLELGTALESRIIEALSNLYPYRITQPSDDGNFGIGLWSKMPLQDEAIFHLTDPLVPSISATVRWEGQAVRVFATHPIPPMSSRYFQTRNRHLELLAGKVRMPWETKGEVAAVVVVGDLNLTPWSPWYQQFLADAELEDCVGGDRMASLTPTWYRWPLFPFGLVLDHGFCGGGLRCSNRRVLEDIGSDHRPVLLEFVRTAVFSLQEVENLKKK
jgi:endonuclease/exonuclease/phosphatase (EEP) superfamily protein YafD